MEETGENVRKISDTGFHPSWSPDGKKIVVSDKAAAIHTVHTIPNSSLFVLDVATGNKTKIETGGDAIMPNWSPNGHRIAFWLVADGKLLIGIQSGRLMASFYILLRTEKGI